jgi:hypothetical protein
MITKAQTNLVLNGGFESYLTCPNNPGQLNRATPWIDPNNSSTDFWHSCNPNQIPCTFSCMYFYQYPRTGNGMAGLYCFNSSIPNYREYAQGILMQQLILGKCYYIEFYANLSNPCHFALNNLGLFFSNSPISASYRRAAFLNPDIYATQQISDTLGWTKISGIYSATGTETLITIGVLQGDTLCSPVQINTVSGEITSYYYIDDVSVIELPQVNTGPNRILCTTNDSVQLGTTHYDGVGYQWLPAIGISNDTIGNPKAAPAQTTTYVLKQTTPCGITYDTVVVQVGYGGQTLSLNACNQTSINGITYTSSGTYSQTLQAANGCDSTVTLNLIINTTPTNTLLLNGSTLIANDTTATNYQWYNCTSGFLAIAGANNYSYELTANGDFALVLSNGTCADTSDCVSVMNVGYDELPVSSLQFQIIPNPSNGAFALNLHKQYKNINIEITDVLGKIIYTNAYKESPQIPIELNAPSGVYFVNVIADDKQQVLKLIKE